MGSRDAIKSLRYADLGGGVVTVETLVTLPGVSEGQLIDVMQALVHKHPRVKLSCLPHMQDDYRETELGLRGEPDKVAEADTWLRAALAQAGFEFTVREH